MSAANNAADGTTDKKKDQTSPIKDRGKPENGSPARFDSVPARVRFDSQPSAKRFDSPPSRIRFDSAPTKAPSQKEPSKQVEQTAKDKTSNSEKIVTTPVNKESAKNSDNKPSYINSATSKSPNSTKISATSESESSKTNESVVDKSDTKILKVVEKENQKSKPDSSKDKDCNLKHVDKKSNLAEDSASPHSVHNKVESTKSAVVKSTKVVQPTAAKETITVVNDEIGSRSKDKEKSTEGSRQTKLTSEVKGSGFADSDGTKSSKPSSSTNRDSEEMEASVPKEIEASSPTEREASSLAEDKASEMVEKRASESARKQSSASAEELTSKVKRKQASESAEKQASEPEEKEAAESAKKEDSQSTEVTAVKTKVVLFAGHKKAESDAACEPTSAKPKVVLFTGHKKPESEVNSETPSAKPKVVLFTGHKKPESESTSEPTVVKPKVVLYTGHKKPESDASVEPSVVKPKVVLFTGHKKPEVPTTAEPTGAKPKVVLFTGHKRPESDGSVESPAVKPKVVLFTGHKKPESETRAEPATARPKVVLFTGHKRPPMSVPKTADTQLLRDIKVEVGAQKRLLEEANSGDEGSSNAKKKRTGGVIEESSRHPSEDSEAGSVLKITECVSISLDDGDKMDTSDGVKNTSADDSSKDGIDADKDTGLPCIAISDIRSVSEDGAPHVVALDEDQAKSNDSDKTDKGDSSGKGKGINAIANKLVKERSDDKKDPSAPGAKKASNDTEAEIKTYATDTMNELLGLFGYDKMDESVRDELKLKSSISGNKDKIGDVKEEVGENVTEGTSATSEGKKDEKDKAKELAAKEKDPEGGRTCTECNQVKKTCKFQVLMHESTRFLCDDNCFKAFRSRQKLTTSVTSTPENRPQTRSVTAPKDFCQLCSREIKNGQGFLPGVGENKPLCSEECTRKYQMTHAPKRACAQCGSAILGRNKCLTWETMEYCNEDCLGKYQSYLGSHCACCNNAVQRTSLGKYCVRFGSDIKQFCSNNCLEEFKKGLKVCSFCQKDISSGTEGFLAPVGDKGQFKDFCSQQCMEKYETMNNSSKSQPAIHQCSVCNKMAAIKVQVMFEGKSHKLCSEPCIAAFRYANKINTSICDTCHKFFDVDVANPHTIQHEGLSKRFCAKTCMNIFVLSHRKIVPCTWCKVKKYNFDMIERVDSNNSVQLFCSLNCLSLFRVSLNATSSRSVRCDFCHHSRPAQYHLTMSDASIRNFCSYPCVMSFQGQFTNVTPVTPSPPVPQQSSTGTSTQVSSNHTSTPVISSVMSLAPQQQQQQHLQQQHVAQQQPAPIQKPVASTRHYGGPRKPPPVVITPSPPAVQSAPLSTATATPTASASTQVAQQVIIKPPLPKQLKNKALLCKPFMQTKGVSCKPHPCHKSVQTDDTIGKSVIIPVPIPIYVPTPMHMYVSPVPVPIPFPLPLPVPVFIPTTKTTSESILKQIKDIREKIPTNPFEAELLMMAEMVAGAEKNGKKGRRGDRDDDRDEDDQDDDRDYDGMDDGFDDRDDDKDDEKDDGKDELNSIISGDQNREKDSDSDTDTRRSSIVGDNNNSKENPAVTLTRRPSKRQRDADSSNADENTNDVVSPRSLRARSRKAPKPTRKENKGSGSKKGRGRGRKKARLEDAEPDTPPASVAPISDSNLVLKFTYGVNAWKHWVLQKNTQLEKASQSNRKLKLFKTDLLQLTADELNYSLCLFVKEVRKPNGDEYAPDSIFYLCLGIQQYLFESSRIDNIFTDAYYEKFTECLNEVLQRYDLAVAAEGCMLSRIEEEILWESKQLGAHSPHVLLNTLMYFNTKFFMLKTIDDHLRLSFSHVMKHWKKAPGSSGGGGRGGSGACVTGTPGRNVLLRYCPPPPQRGETGRKRKDDQPVFEQIENQDNPLRCPVKLYEFYLSKCPESIKNRSDVFYLYPERSCVPDSPVWYSTMPLGREAVSKMLQRIKMVREVSDILMPDS